MLKLLMLINMLIQINGIIHGPALLHIFLSF